MGDALVEAYRERAIEVCRRSLKKPAGVSRDDVANAWATSRAEVVIGNPDVRLRSGVLRTRSGPSASATRSL